MKSSSKTRHSHPILDATIVGERGQIVIPKSIREELELTPGTRLMVMHPKDGPIILLPLDHMRKHLDQLSKKMAALLDKHLS